MNSAADSFSVTNHDWHSPSYVEEWIARDLKRDEERRTRLRKMLAVATFAPDAAIAVLDVGGGYVQCDLRDPSWIDRIGGPFDLAVSAIAIHNLGDLAAMAACYRGIVRVLKPGVPFLDYDLFDRFGGIPVHTRLLQEAGFGRVDLIWQQSPVAIAAAYADSTS